jgi:hypothetical protein
VTAKELIKLLEALPPDMPVVLPNASGHAADGDYHSPSAVTVRKAFPDRFRPGEFVPGNALLAGEDPPAVEVAYLH